MLVVISNRKIEWRSQLSLSLTVGIVLFLSLPLLAQIEFERRALADESMSIAPWFIGAVDFDGDGDIDVLSSSNEFGLVWHEQLDDLSFGTSVLWEQSYIWAFATVDVDGDDDIDVISTSPKGLTLHRNEGLDSLTDIHLVEESGRMFVGDIEGDMHPDIVIERNGDMLLLINLGNGSFQDAIVLDTLYSPRALSIIDLDTDGDADLVQASTGDFTSRISWYQNNGAGNFERVEIAFADRVFNLVALDLDLDGDIDLLTNGDAQHQNDDALAWYENDGNQVFVQHVLPGAANGDIAAADLDLDQYIDIIAVTNAGLEVLKNDGTEQFESVLIDDPKWPVFIADLDSDGVTDIIAGDHSSRVLVWYENLICDENLDMQPPLLEHDPISFAGIFNLPVPIAAVVTDDCGVGDVWVEYRVNDGQTSSFELIASDDRHVGSFPCTNTEVVVGDSVFYRLFARDNTPAGNLTSLGEYGFEIQHSAIVTQTINEHIPDQTVEGISFTVQVAIDTALSIADVDVLFEATHETLGDLSLWLTSPFGTMAKLIERPGHPATTSGDLGNDPDIVLDDEGEETIELLSSGNGEIVAGRFRPYPDLLSVFDGDDPNGEWTIRVNDESSIHSGIFRSWGLVLTLAIAETDTIVGPTRFYLHQNYPNPFNSSTVINLQLPIRSNVSLTVYNVNGQVVRKLIDEKQWAAGEHDVTWDGTNDAGAHVASGVYFYRLSYIPPGPPSKG